MQCLKVTGKEKGQIAIMFAIVLPVLLLFVGFGIDFGFGFLTKAELAKASDAVSLAVMRNLGRGTATATAIGQSEFGLNYNSTSGLNVLPPSLEITYGADSYGEPIVNVTATATIRTFFIRLAGINTLTVANFSQATRPPVILSLVLDRSGSMANPSTGGATALPTAVTDFLGYFIVGTDRLGQVSFSSADSVDVAVTQNFLTPIKNSLKSMQFVGATYAQGGLNDAYTQVTGVTSPPPNAVKVAVFFTDGWANTIQDKMPCSNPSILLNYGGTDSGDDWYFFDPTTGAQHTEKNYCSSVTTFPAQYPAPTHQQTLSRANITSEAESRMEALANTMRAQGITIYSIGLGNSIDQSFLQQIANDPASSTYDASKPSGIAVFAPSANDLDTAFQTIASKILLRLTN